jgi:ubiquinone/menaquinone biosynthesis C-methylase UbiE
MMTRNYQPTDTGSVNEFRRSWKASPELKRYHFRRGEPENQVQFAFQNHWRIFKQILEGPRLAKVVEVGSGRGSMGAFFADKGVQTHLLDTSYDVLHSAAEIYIADGMQAKCTNGDALALPYAGNAFDAVVSIGLLEHFAEIKTPLQEQLRVLQPGGVLLVYVVPESPFSAQILGAPVNAMLKIVHSLGVLLSGKQTAKLDAKQSLFRNDFKPELYLDILRQMGVKETGIMGMFPIALITHSHAFPYSPMAPVLEHCQIAIWRAFLGLRKTLFRHDPWICSTSWGQAFLVWARKPGGNV